MNIDNILLDKLTAEAKVSPRLRMNLDLRDSDADSSQRMLNAIEPGSVIPVHRHRKTSETVVILRGSAVQYLYDDAGNVTGKVLLAPWVGEIATALAGPRNDVGAAELRNDVGAAGIRNDVGADGLCNDVGAAELRSSTQSMECQRKNDVGIPAMQVEIGQWHRLEALESGTVIVEFKNGPYEPIGDEDILKNAQV